MFYKGEENFNVTYSYVRRYFENCVNVNISWNLFRVSFIDTSIMAEAQIVTATSGIRTKTNGRFWKEIINIELQRMLNLKKIVFKNCVRFDNAFDIFDCYFLGADITTTNNQFMRICLGRNKFRYQQYMSELWNLYLK